MTGERWGWFRVASHLKMLVDELKARITYSEFLDWLTYLRKAEIERDAKHEFYLANIAAEICRSRVTKPEQIQTKSFLVGLLDDEEGSSEPQLVVRNIEGSKSIWAGALGIKLN